MAKWIEWTSRQKEIYSQWLDERPQVIKDIVGAHNIIPDELYVLKTTGQRVTLQSINESGTVTVNVLAKYNKPSVMRLGVDFAVFGINPADLEPCDLPEGVEVEVMEPEKIEALHRQDLRDQSR